MINIKKITVNNGKYRIRIMLAAVVVGLFIGWFLPIWTHQYTALEGIDGKLQQCVMDLLPVSK